MRETLTLRQIRKRWPYAVWADEMADRYSMSIQQADTDHCWWRYEVDVEAMDAHEAQARLEREAERF